MKIRLSFFLLFVCAFYLSSAQIIEQPVILEIVEDDHVATIYWNSKSNTYDPDYDPEKLAGVFSYKVEWGNVNEGFSQTAYTPYRAHQCQPLLEGADYMAKIYALDAYGNQSEASEVIYFSHDPSRVNDMRSRLTGFFDDMNRPMGAFDEKKWNQSYSGCMSIGKVSQHINNQFHGHNVIASGHCDRGAASSRARELFDFTDRTGIIEFDLDGSQKGRQFWYLDLTNGNRKRDLSGHTSFFSSNSADPKGMLRIAEIGPDISIQISNEYGQMFTLSDMYQDGACGDRLYSCGGENLNPLINVRKHWRIELSKTHIRIFIDDIKVIDGSLISEHSPNGLEYEVAQVNWLTFSYNTTKDNFEMYMVHWDNFGFDAPPGYQAETTIHNYTDGFLGTESPRIGNEMSIGMDAELDEPGVSSILIPDSIIDNAGNQPMKSELMFTVQSGHYNWSDVEYIKVNGHTYPFLKPESTVENMPLNELINTIRPYSAIIELDPNHLVTGDNQIEFFMNHPRLLNIHIELTYPIETAPEFTPPYLVYEDHTQKLMGFRNYADEVGPGIVFKQIDDSQFWLLESEYWPTPDIERWYIMDQPVSDQIELVIQANSMAQMGATGVAKGIAYYELWIDKVPVETIRVDVDSPVSFFRQEITLDISEISDGIHELYVQAYDTHGNVSGFDAFQAHGISGKYLPTLIDVQNTTTTTLNLEKTNISVYPNPSDQQISISTTESFELEILDCQGRVLRSRILESGLSTVSINDLNMGVYFLKFSSLNGKQNQIEKLIKL